MKATPIHGRPAGAVRVSAGLPALPPSLLAGLWGIAVLLPNLAVAVRRLRDAGYGWGNLFWILVPLAGIVVLWAQPTKTVMPVTTAAAA